MNETTEKHYYGAGSDDGQAESMAVRAAELGWHAFVHYHPYGDGKESCQPACRKVRVAP